MKIKYLIFTLLFAVVSFWGMAQVSYPSAPDYRFTAVCDCALPLSTTLSNANKWAITQLTDNPNSVFCDTITKQVIVKSSVVLPSRHDYSNSTEEPTLFFTVTFEFKENRYRICVDNMSVIERTTSFIPIINETNYFKEEYNDQQIFSFDPSPWVERAKVKERRLSEIENTDKSALKKKERKRLEQLEIELRKDIECEYNSAEREKRVAEKLKTDIIKFLNDFAQTASTQICTQQEEW